MPERLARLGHDPHEGLDRLHGGGPPFDRFLAADRLEPQLVPSLHEHADAVAADDPPGLVGEYERGMDRIEPFVHGPTEPLDLGQGRLLLVERDELLLLATSLQVAAGGHRQLLQEPHESPLDVLRRRHLGVVDRGMMEDLDETGAGVAHVDGRGDDEQVRGIARELGAVRPREFRTRRHADAVGGSEKRLHERAMRLLALGGRQRRVLDAGMADRLDASLGIHEPDQAGDGLHRADRPVEKTAEELLLAHVSPAEPLDLGHERANLLAGAFDLHGLVGAAHDW